MLTRGDRVRLAGDARRFSFILELKGDALLRYDIPPNDVENKTRIARGLEPLSAATRYETAPASALERDGS